MLLGIVPAGSHHHHQLLVALDPARRVRDGVPVSCELQSLWGPCPVPVPQSSPQSIWSHQVDDCSAGRHDCRVASTHPRQGAARLWLWCGAAPGFDALGGLRLLVTPPGNTFSKRSADTRRAAPAWSCLTWSWRTRAGLEGALFLHQRAQPGRGPLRGPTRPHSGSGRCASTWWVDVPATLC